MDEATPQPSPQLRHPQPLLTRVKTLLWSTKLRRIGLILILVAIMLATVIAQQLAQPNKGVLPPVQTLRTSNSNPQSSTTATLETANNFPNCSTAKQLLQQSPVAVKDLSTIIPMGNIAPPGHIGPTPHMYYNYLNIGSKANPIPALTTIYAPTDITITQITLFDNASAIHPFNSYRIDFNICKQVTGYFIHTVSLSDKLSAIMQPPYSSTQTSMVGGTVPEHTYGKLMNLKVTAGEKIGTGGGGVGKPAGLDFGLVDNRSPMPTEANPARWKYDSHYVCSLDYYPSDLSATLYQHIGNYYNQFLEPGNPKCGTVYQDIPGTAQGVWFTRDVPTNQLGDPAQEITLAHSNLNHAQGVFGLGNKLQTLGVDPSQPYLFTPKTTGNTNLDFSLVKPNNQIYCYQLPNQNDFNKPDTVLLLQMLDSSTLRLGSLSSGQCGTGPWQFSQYIDYVR